MKTKLKYMKFFGGISPSDIPYFRFDDNNIRTMIVIINSDIKELPEIYNQLTDEIDGYIDIVTNSKLITINSFNNLNRIGISVNITNNNNLTNISGFNSLTEISGNLGINDNENLIYISGFDSIKNIGSIFLDGCNKLIFISIPSKLINSVCYERNYFISINLNKNWIYRKQEWFINNSRMIQDCIDKFDPSIHPDVVVKQIIENLEIWGEPDNIKTIINHILSKGDYWEYIPESMKQYVDDHYHHLYNAKYAKTGARGIAKMNTGRYLGMF